MLTSRSSLRVEGIGDESSQGKDSTLPWRNWLPRYLPSFPVLRSVTMVDLLVETICTVLLLELFYLEEGSGPVPTDVGSINVNYDVRNRNDRFIEF